MSDEGRALVICGRDDVGDLDRCDVVVVDVERVRAVRERLVTAATAERMAAVFKVLADPSRCRIVAALIAAGEICVCDLAATVGMSESSVSHHLRVLRASRLVRARRDGRMVFYSPDDAHIAQLLELTREHVAHEAQARQYEPGDSVACACEALVTERIHRPRRSSSRARATARGCVDEVGRELLAARGRRRRRAGPCSRPSPRAPRRGPAHRRTTS